MTLFYHIVLSKLELTDGLSQSDDHFLACGELCDPAHDALHSVHPHFQLHCLHPEALIPLTPQGGANSVSCPSLKEQADNDVRRKDF